MTISVDMGRKATTKQIPTFLYKTLCDIVLMVDRNKGAILEFIAIVCWINCYIFKTMHLCIGCVHAPQSVQM